MYSNRQPHSPYAKRGFTLIELVMVIVILGVLAVVAAPRIFSNNDVNARGFHDEAIGYLRYAQKTAIAQRRTVCVSFVGTSITLKISTTPATFTCSPAGTFSGPNGAATLTAKSGVAYSIAPASFNFDGLGQPINNAGAPSATQTFQVASVNRSITVEGLTGYVHE
jgi:MSHA pilin protein MshC